MAAKQTKIHIEDSDKSAHTNEVVGYFTLWEGAFDGEAHGQTNLIGDPNASFVPTEVSTEVPTVVPAVVSAPL